MRKIILLLIICFLVNYNLFAHLTIKISPKDGEIYVKNSAKFTNVKAFLVFYNMDAKDNEKFYSYNYTKGKWIKGIFPIVENSIDIPKFQFLKITKVPFKCNENEKCFIGIFLKRNGKLIDISVYPLNEKASEERIKGQWIFSEKTIEARNKVFTPSEKIENEKKETEKPDIYKIYSHYFLYADAQAGKFIVVDIKNPLNPEIIGELNFNGNPKEVYYLNGYFIVLSEYKNQTEIISSEMIGNSLKKIDYLIFDGAFKESRRIGKKIFIVTSNSPNIYAIGVSGNGNLEELQKIKLSNFPKIVSIFQNALVIVTNNNFTSGDKLCVYPITEGAIPLDKPIIINVNGYIPSDRHIFCKKYGDKELLFFVASPIWAERDKGSTFYVYDAYIGNELARISNIAPGESLYATVFTSKNAYIVTYRQTDPLWVIDIKNPEAPKIIGKLKLPGWSEKLFFYENKLLSIGYYNENSKRLISVKLFDVENPEKPKLLGQLVPLKEQANYSYSEATNDERAFFRDWNSGLFSFPLVSGGKNYIYAFRLKKDKLVEIGSFIANFYIKRTFFYNKKYLGGFSTRNLLIFDINSPKSKILFPLVTAIDYVKLLDNNTILGISKSQYIDRIFKISKDLKIEKDYFVNTNFYSFSFSNSESSILLYSFLPENRIKFSFFTLKNGLSETFEIQNRLKTCYFYNPLVYDKIAIFPQSCFGKVRKNGMVVFENGNKSDFINIPGTPILVLDNNTIITMENIKNGVNFNLIKFNFLEAYLENAKFFGNCNYPSIAFANNFTYLACNEKIYKLHKKTFQILSEYNFDKNYDIIDV